MPSRFARHEIPRHGQTQDLAHGTNLQPTACYTVVARQLQRWRARTGTKHTRRRSALFIKGYSSCFGSSEKFAATVAMSHLLATSKWCSKNAENPQTELLLKEGQMPVRSRCCYLAVNDSRRSVDAQREIWIGSGNTEGSLRRWSPRENNGCTSPGTWPLSDGGARAPNCAAVRVVHNYSTTRCKNCLYPICCAASATTLIRRTVLA